MKGLTKFFLAFALSLFLAVPVFAIPILDFRDGDGSGGTITVSGNNITGTNIALDALSAQGTTADGTWDLTGPLNPGGDTFADMDFTWDGKTGTISIVGGLGDALQATQLAPGTQAILPDTLLLSGTITKLTVTNNTPSLFAFNASGIDTKDPGLLEFFGVDPTRPFTFLSFEIAANSNNTGSPYTASSTDVNNQGKVPEPTTMILFGMGFAGAGLYRRLRKKSVK